MIAEEKTAASSTAGSENGRIAAPSISLPKGGGAIRGIGEKFGANPVTGTGSMSLPIPKSPGRSGFGPQLSLSYDSGSGNGPFGVGWNLSLPTITRKTDKGLPIYDDARESDVFVLSGAEDLVPVLVNNNGRWERQPFGSPPSEPGYTVQRYRPRSEGLFARIERWTDKKTGISHWRSISRGNITTFYGNKTMPESLIRPIRHASSVGSFAKAMTTRATPSFTDTNPRTLLTWIRRRRTKETGSSPTNSHSAT